MQTNTNFNNDFFLEAKKSGLQIEFAENGIQDITIFQKIFIDLRPDTSGLKFIDSVIKKQISGLNKKIKLLIQISQEYKSIPIELYELFRLQKIFFTSDLQIEEFIGFIQSDQGKKVDLKLLHNQNKYLELELQSLEQAEQSNSENIEFSTKEEQLKQIKIKSIIQFIQDLSTRPTVDELTAGLRLQLKQSAKLGDPILIYKLNNDKSETLIYFRSGFAQTKILKDNTLNQISATKDSNKIKLLLADIVQRPIQNTIFYNFKMFSYGSEEIGSAYLFIEHNLSSKEIEDAKNDIESYVQPFQIAIERSIIEEQTTLYSYRWEKTFDDLHSPIAILNFNRSLIRGNKAFVNSSSQQTCFQSLFGPQAEKCVNCPVDQVEISKKSYSSQISSNEKLYQVHSFPIRQNATTVVNFYVDVTRTSSLKAKALQSEKMQEIGRLAGNIAHEINNPLTGIRSLSQVLLLQVDKQSTLYSDLKEIEKASERSQKIIKNLQEFSSDQTESLKVFDIDDLIEKTIPILKTSLRYHRTQIDLNTNRHFSYGDPHLIQQVIFNLINNACQAMENPGQLTIKTEEVAVKDKDFIKVHIQDTGLGISAENLKKIFEPFYTTKKAGMGTGLGLSISKSIIEKYGGYISVQSKIGEGSTFSVFLPKYQNRGSN